MPKGGRREGAGRKPWGGRYGEPTQAVRVPTRLAPYISEIIAAYERQSSNNNDLVDQLEKLLNEWDKKTYCEDYSKNPRKKFARLLWSDLKSLIDLCYTNQKKEK